MFKKAFQGIFLFKIVLVLSKEAELPLCPTNVAYLPQNLPMHCRMPTSADFPRISALPGVPQNQSPPFDKQSPQPVPFPLPPGFPGPMPIPGSMPLPGPMVGPMSMPGPMPMPGSMPMPGPMPIPGPVPFPGPMPLPSGPGHKLPVIVMPFYSPDPSFKKNAKPIYPQHSLGPKKRRTRHRRRRPFIYPSDTSGSPDTDTSSETSSGSSSEYQGWWKGRRNHRKFNGPIRMKKRKRFQKRQLLTPVLQYVTKDGYVIFEKKISKTEAKDWLNVKKDEKLDAARISPEAREMESKEINEDRSTEKEAITEDNVEVVTRRISHRINRIKPHAEKFARRKLERQPR